MLFISSKTCWLFGSQQLLDCRNLAESDLDSLLFVSFGLEHPGVPPRICYRRGSARLVRLGRKEQSRSEDSEKHGETERCRSWNDLGLSRLGQERSVEAMTLFQVTFWAGEPVFSHANQGHLCKCELRPQAV